MACALNILCAHKIDGKTKLPMPVPLSADAMKYYTVAVVATAATAKWYKFNQLIYIQVASVALAFAFHRIRVVKFQIPFRDVVSISTTLRYENKFNCYVWSVRLHEGCVRKN